MGAMTHSVNLNRLAVFAALVRAGSLTAAAAPLGISKAMVGQHLARLEAELGVALVVRTTRRMALTEAGTAFYADCVRILAETEAAIERVAQEREQPKGTLRVTSTTDYGVAVVAPALAAFMREFPQLRVDLLIGDEIRDLVAERIDVSIRVGWLRDSSARQVRLAVCQQWLVAAPRYLSERGTPRRPTDLARHSFIVGSLLPTPSTVAFTGKDGHRHTVRVRHVAQANNASAIRELVLHLAGIAVLPDYLVSEDVRAGRLVALLAPRYRLRDGGIHAVYPGPHASAKVRLFVDYLRKRLL